MSFLFYFIFKNLFICFLQCWVFIALGLSLVVESGDYFLVVVHGLLIVVASLGSELRF